jgi:5-methylcytosine-specific restriction enzyme A
MSTFRWKNLPPFRKDRFGYYLCRLCKKPCAEDSKHWCSEECLRKYLTISNGSFVRAQLFERDLGICSECGVNGAQMNDALARLKDDLLHPLLMTIHPMIVTTLRAEGWNNVKLRGKGSYADAIEFTSCWEADHVQTVADGGGQCGLDNYRTLCFVCHKRASKEQSTARARARRMKKTPSDKSS